MSRRRRAVKREILPDAKFGDIVISRLTPLGPDTRFRPLWPTRNG